MKKRKIAIDVDDVLLDFSPSLWNYYNQRYGTSLGPDDCIYYDLEKVWGGTKERAIEIVSDFYKTEQFRRIRPTEGAQQAVKVLSARKELRVVTSRPSFIEDITREALREHFGEAFTDVFFNGQYGTHSSGLDKSGYCLKNGIFVILEDNVDIAEKCARKGIRAFLFDKKWNQRDRLPLNLKRVGIGQNPWEEVLRQLK